MYSHSIEQYEALVEGKVMSGNINSFLPITDVYDVDIIRGLDINSEEFKEFLVRLRQSINNMAISINSRDGGYYGLGEYNSGAQFFPNTVLEYRTVLRTVVDFGTLPNNAAKSVNHNINSAAGGTNANYIFTRIYATASDPIGFTYIPIPYVAVGGNIVALIVTQTQVTITTNFNATNYTQCYVVLEYVVN
jgi:hypothetical protein